MDAEEVAAGESHPLEPFLPPGAGLLMCGTFPPARNRWSMDFYYPNYINDMWRIFGLIYFGDKDALVDTANKTFRLDEIKHLLEKVGIALSDTGREIVRTKGNAADKWLQIDTPIDLGGTLMQLPACRAVATTGEKAAGIVAGLTSTSVPKVGEWTECVIPLPDGTARNFRHWRMPSSSRAYPMKIEKKAEYYAKMLSEENLINT
jgi:G:T/U-mismatch repair DNA glycosylase